MSADLFGVITCFYGTEASTFMLLSEESQNTQTSSLLLSSSLSSVKKVMCRLIHLFIFLVKSLETMFIIRVIDDSL